MLALLLKRCCSREKHFFRDAFCGQEIRHLRLAGGDGTGLVEHDRIHAAGLLEGLRRLIQNAVLCAHTVADHDGDRRRQAECARAADDEHADAAGDSKAELFAEEQPRAHCQECEADDRGHKDGRDFIGDPCERCLGGCRIADHPDDLRERGVLADAGRPTGQETALIDRRRLHGIAGRFVDRDALAGERRFVDGAFPIHDDTVHRDVFAGPHNKQITRADLFNGHFGFIAVPQHDRRFRGQLHQAFERIGRSALGHRFEQLADRDQRRDHRRRFEVEIHSELVDRSAVAFSHGVDHDEKFDEGISERGSRSQRDQRVHVRRAVGQALKAAREEFAVDGHDDDGDEHLEESQGHVVLEESRDGPAEHHVPHGEIHEDDKEAQRGK